MKNVVYFLGAGFSAPAGLPVISNFLMRAKQQFYSSKENQERFSHFKEVFAYIDSLAVIKNYINADLYNIEELFSIADMHTLLNTQSREAMERLIKDVIEYHTPQTEMLAQQFQRSGITPTHADLFGNSIASTYISFLSCLAGIRMTLGGERGTTWMDRTRGGGRLEPVSKYRFVSTNYDRLIEMSVGFLERNYGINIGMPLAKLHGSVETDIIPPTWQKSILGGIKTAWVNAAEWMSQANEIRILGYSFPQTDVYIKHLFSTSLSKAPNLQRIDVICLDSNQNLESHYRSMFSFPNFYFHNRDLLSYMTRFSDSFSSELQGINHTWKFGDSERLHLDALV